MLMTFRACIHTYSTTCAICVSVMWVTNRTFVRKAAIHDWTFCIIAWRNKTKNNIILEIYIYVVFLLQEAYRRWGCSSLIPFFAEPDDIRPRRTVNDADSASTSTVRSGTTVVSSAATTNQPAAAASAVQQRQQRDVEGSSHVHKQHYSKTSWLSASMSSSSSSSSTSSRTIIASGDARQTVVVNGAASPEVTRGRSGISNVMPWTSSSSKSASLESIRNGNHRAKRHNNNDRNNTFSMTTTTSTTGDSQGDYNSKTSNSSTNDSATSTQTFRHEEDPIAARSLRR